jgi:hypothetical protein
VIEKGSGTGSLEQAVDDIKTFAKVLSDKLDGFAVDPYFW